MPGHVLTGAVSSSSGSEGSGGPDAAGAAGSAVEVPLRIFRGGEVLEVGVQLGLEDGLGTDRLVHWCGAQLQASGPLQWGAQCVLAARFRGAPARRCCQ